MTAGLLTADGVVVVVVGFITDEAVVVVDCRAAEDKEAELTLVVEDGGLDRGLIMLAGALMFLLLSLF